MLLGFIIANAACSATIAAAHCPQQEAAAQNGSPVSSETKRVPQEAVSESELVPSENPPRIVTATNSLFEEQKEIWTSPFRLRVADMEWLLPAAGLATASFATDRSLSRSLSSQPASLSRFNRVRSGSLAGLGAASAGMYLWSLRTRDRHQRETGLLASEAMADTLMVTEGLKSIAARQRPTQGLGQGKFFADGNGFPSNHSAAAWAAAGILAHEYPGPLTKLLAYGLASTVSIASVGSKQHFGSDALIGSAAGWFISEYVYRKRHDPQLGGSAWKSIPFLAHETEPGSYARRGSAYIPLDSWIYLAFDRLSALGLVASAFQGTRPWTRAQCVRLLQEADDSAAGALTGPSIDAQIRGLLVALHHEFSREEKTSFAENGSAEIESIYSRVLSASGTVLTDGYHFGQTYAYDFGRPFRRGTNVISGGSFSASYGDLFFHFGGEFEHSPLAPGLSSAQTAFIADRDRVSRPSGAALPPANQFQLLDAYAGINLSGWQVSFGNQSLSWGPGAGGSLLLSDNAAPFPMLRIAPDAPIEVPGLSRILGPFQLEQFYGRLAGHPGPSEPWIYGQKISFKPFRSLEFAYARTTLVGGSGHPLTARNFFYSLVGRVDPARNSVPGDSRTAVEWTWRIPQAHNWATFYGELENDDDPIPFKDPSKCVVRPGMYFARLPLFSSWDLHFEYTSSTSPGRNLLQRHGELNYWNLDYTSGYTNVGSLIGNIVGREGITVQAWTRYWISARHTFDFSWKQSRVLSDYIPGGGKWQDYQAGYSFAASHGWYAKGLLQFEQIFSFPLLFSGARKNVVASLEIGFHPVWAHRGESLTAQREAALNVTGQEAVQ